MLYYTFISIATLCAIFISDSPNGSHFPSIIECHAPTGNVNINDCDPFLPPDIPVAHDFILIRVA